MKKKGIARVSTDRTISFSERIAKLNKRRQELIRPVQEDPREYVLRSIRSMAEKLHTDPATVVRIVRGLGFGSYKDFKAYLHALSIASATSLQGMQATRSSDSSLAAHARKALDQDLRNLHALRNTLDLEQVVYGAQKIHHARRILLIGGDMAIGLVEFLDYKLTLLGLPVVAATTPGKTVHAMRSMGIKDVTIAVSFRRCLRQTVEGLQQARSQGVYCIGITDTFVSPIARFANQCFLTSVEAPFSSSYAAPISFINVLFAICARSFPKRTLTVLKKVDYEQRHGYRWYSE